MTVGLPQTKDQIDARAGSLVLNLRTTFDQIHQFKTQWLDTTAVQDSYLTGLGYTADDVANLRQVYAALDTLYGVAHGQAAQPAASDFFYHATTLTGVQ